MGDDRYSSDYVNAQRNKRGSTLNLKRPEGVGVLLNPRQHVPDRSLPDICPATPGLADPAGVCLSATGCGNERRRAYVPHVVGDVDRSRWGDDLVDAVEHVG